MNWDKSYRVSKSIFAGAALGLASGLIGVGLSSKMDQAPIIWELVWLSTLYMAIVFGRREWKGNWE